jgi:predicted double-glycine peptidase
LIPNYCKFCLALLLLLSAAQAQTPATVPPGAFWIDVPYIHQPREGCGAASLAMVMTYWAVQQGKKPGPESDVALIQRELYSPRDHGITAQKMSEYLDQHNFKAFALAGSWTDLEEQLRKGRPLIVALKPNGQKELHYVVVDGIDSARGIVMVSDPALRKLLTRERAGFEKEWSATHNWMLLALPSANPQ